MFKLLCIGLFCFLLTSLQEPGTVKLESASTEGKIAAAVYNYQIKQCYPEMKDKIYFLGFYESKVKDLPKPFMAQFKDHQPPVKKYSEMLRSGGDRNTFTDKDSGRQAALLMIATIKIVSETKAEVEGSCGAAELAAKGYKYTVESESGKWQVKGNEPIWVF